jgi:WD40 repeat protein
MKTSLACVRCAVGLLVAVFVANSASAEPIAIETPQRATPVDFAADVLPILRANCLACHSGQKAEASLNLETPESIRKGGEQGPAVVAGKSGESLLLKVAAHQQESFMPPAENNVGAKPLSPAQLGLIQLWIDQGAGGSVSANRPVHWQPLPKSHQPIFAAAVTPDGQYAICSRGNELFVYDLPALALVTKLVDPSLASPASGSPAAVAHCDIIRSLAINRTGDTIASGGFREVKLWRRPRAVQAAAWELTSPATATALSGDGKLAAIGDGSGRVTLWDVAAQKQLHLLAAHSAAVTGLAFSLDGKTIYTTSLDKSLKAWQTTDGTAVGKPSELAAPIHSLALLSSGDRLVTGTADGKVQVWDAAQWQKNDEAQPAPLKEIEAQTGAVVSLVAHPTQAGEFFAGSQDGVVRQFDAASGNKLREWNYGASLSSLAVSPSGEQIATGGGGIAKLWNATDGKLVAEFKDDPRMANEVARIDAEIAFTKTGVAQAKQDIKLYEGPERRIKTTADDVKKAEDGLVKAEKTRDEKKAALDKAKADSKDAKKLEAAQKAFDQAQTATEVAQTIIDRAKVIAERAVKTLAEAEADVVAREARQKQQEAEKEAALAKLKQSQPSFSAVAFSPNSERLAIGSEDGAIHFYRAQNGLPIETVVGPSTAIMSLAFSSNEKLLTCGDKQAVLWDAPAQWRLERVIGADESTAAPVDRVLALDFSPDGTLLATGGGLPARSGELKLWKVADGRLAREIPAAHSDTIFAVRFSPDGKQLATCGADRLVKIFDAASGELKQTLAGHTAHVLGLSWQADGKVLASCGTDRAIKLWDVEHAAMLRSLKGTMYQIGAYKGEVTAVAFIGDSEQILAASGDGTVRLHRTTSDNDLLVFTGSAGYPYCVAATPDARTLLSGGSDGVLRVWSGMDRGLKQSFEP